MLSYTLVERARHIKLLALDVDGVLSNGQLTFSNSGEELKSFDVRDGLGIKLVQKIGIKVVVITGRNSHIVNNRMKSLGVDLIIQGREDKGLALQEACTSLHIKTIDCAYIGDDWPDLAAFTQVGLAVTVPNGHIELKKRAHFITQATGGNGAVRELCDILIQAQGKYDELLTQFLTGYDHTLAHSR